MRGMRKPIIVRMNLANRDQVQFKVRPKDGKFKFGGDDKSYMVMNDRVRRVKGKPMLEYIEGNAEPIDPYGGEVHITPEDYNETGENQYIRQIYASLRSQLATNLQWVLIAVVALAALANFYFNGKTMDQVEILQNQLAIAHPPPAPQPTVR